MAKEPSRTLIEIDTQLNWHLKAAAARFALPKKTLLNRVVQHYLRQSLADQERIAADDPPCSAEAKSA